jgi:hypothetical protein
MYRDLASLFIQDYSDSVKFMHVIHLHFRARLSIWEWKLWMEIVGGNCFIRIQPAVQSYGSFRFIAGVRPRGLLVMISEESHYLLAGCQREPNVGLVLNDACHCSNV